MEKKRRKNVKLKVVKKVVLFFLFIIIIIYIYKYIDIFPLFTTIAPFFGTLLILLTFLYPQVKSVFGKFYPLLTMEELCWHVEF